MASIWMALGLLAGVFSVFHDASHLYDRAQRDTDRGSLGATFDSFCRTDGFCAATKVAPGGPIALVGMRDGDSVRFDHSYDFNRVLRVGETVGFTLEHEGVLTHHTVTARSRPPSPPARLVTSYFLNAMYILTSLVGLLVLLRSRRRAAALLLGAGLACLGLSGTYPSLLESDPRIFPAFLCLVTLVFIAPPILFLGFALAARQEIGKSVGRPWTAVLIAYSTARIITGVYQAWEILSARIAPGIGVAFAFSDAMQDLGYLLCFLVLAAAWRVSGGDQRTRLAFMLVATVLLTTCSQIAGLAINLTGNDWTLGNPLILVMLVGSVCGVLVFAYAILRHRVLDLGFAVNRTLVYAVVSAVLLVAFGLIEWAVDHFVPIHGREENVLIDAAIAVGVFLTFHRVRAVVEQGIEGVFFRRWQQAEAALRRFVREAAFVRSADTLGRAFAAALTRFADGAEAALYLLDDDGYRRASGQVTGIGELIEVDDPALVALRAEPQPLEAALRRQVSTLEARNHDLQVALGARTAV